MRKVKTFEALLKLARNRKAVVVKNWAMDDNWVRPAAFMINFNAYVLNSLLKNGRIEQFKKKVKNG